MLAAIVRTRRATMHKPLLALLDRTLLAVWDALTLSRMATLLDEGPRTGTCRCGKPTVANRAECSDCYLRRQW